MQYQVATNLMGALSPTGAPYVFCRIQLLQMGSIVPIRPHDTFMKMLTYTQIPELDRYPEDEPFVVSRTPQRVPVLHPLVNPSWHLTAVAAAVAIHVASRRWLSLLR
jgi:hypothetical protein